MDKEKLQDLAVVLHKNIKVKASIDLTLKVSIISKLKVSLKCILRSRTKY